MHKIFVMIFMVIPMLFSTAFAATQQELIDIINQARLELTQYLPIVENKTILYEDENIKITCLSLPYFEEYWQLGDKYGTIYLDVIIENHTNNTIMVSFREVSINGWTLDGYGDEVMAGKKIKGSLRFDYIADTDLTAPEDIQDIDGILYYFDTNSWDDIGEGEIYWLF